MKAFLNAVLAIFWKDLLAERRSREILGTMLVFALTVTLAFVFATAFETELTKRLDLKANYNFNLVNQESGTYIHHFMTTLETEITKWLDFDISFVWDRTQDPTPRADGTVPEQNDFQVIFSLGVDF